MDLDRHSLISQVPKEQSHHLAGWGYSDMRGIRGETRCSYVLGAVYKTMTERISGFGCKVAKGEMVCIHVITKGSENLRAKPSEKHGFAIVVFQSPVFPQKLYLSLMWFNPFILGTQRIQANMSVNR